MHFEKWTYTARILNQCSARNIDKHGFLYLLFREICFIKTKCAARKKKSVGTSGIGFQMMIEEPLISLPPYLCIPDTASYKRVHQIRRRGPLYLDTNHKPQHTPDARLLLVFVQFSLSIDNKKEIQKPLKTFNISQCRIWIKYFWITINILSVCS